MSRSLDDLSALIRPKVTLFLKTAKDAGIDLLVTCTLRSIEEQTVLYAQGRTTPGPIVTNAKPGSSAHNYGLAIDVVPLVNGKPLWAFNAMHPGPVWAKVGELGKAAGLQWLGDPGPKFTEGCHFQLPNWKEFTHTNA